MLKYPFRRVWGLFGPPRIGKNEVANFLTETRGFRQFAFADKIKEEFGITNADFETAKISGDIKKLRKELWEFSAEKKKNNPNYFVDMVIDDAKSSKMSVIITDVRTTAEWNEIFNAKFNDTPLSPRIYVVGPVSGFWEEEDDGELYLRGTKITNRFYWSNIGQTRHIHNDRVGLFRFYQKLEEFFFTEDISDLTDYLNKNRYLGIGNSREEISNYISQFNVKEKIQ